MDKNVLSMPEIELQSNFTRDTFQGSITRGPTFVYKWTGWNFPYWTHDWATADLGISEYHGWGETPWMDYTLINWKTFSSLFSTCMPLVRLASSFNCHITYFCWKFHIENSFTETRDKTQYEATTRRLLYCPYTLLIPVFSEHLIYITRIYDVFTVSPSCVYIF